MSSNRREVLLAAGGVAAATSLVSSGHALADKKERPRTPAPLTITVDFDGVGTFAALSYTWGASAVFTTGGGGGGGIGKVNIGNLSFTRYVDAGSPKLLKLLLQGKHTDTVTVTIVERGHQTTYTLEDVLVNSLSEGVSDTELRATENVSVQFDSFTFDVDGTHTGYDSKTSKVT